MQDDTGTGKACVRNSPRLAGNVSQDSLWDMVIRDEVYTDYNNKHQAAGNLSVLELNITEWPLKESECSKA